MIVLIDGIYLDSSRVEAVVPSPAYNHVVCSRIITRSGSAYDVPGEVSDVARRVFCPDVTITLFALFPEAGS